MPVRHNHADCGCGCDKFGGHTMKANLSGEVRYVDYMGRRTLVVPVIMARANVVMNDSLVSEAEMFSPSWNGVPVTVRHPETPDGSGSANHPQTLETYAVGTIFNSSVEDGALRAEAWIDVERAEAVYPGLVAKLESGEPMDVSTGYFSKDIKRPGKINGQSYSVESVDLKPDHLALLPDEIGACSWDDGCGVRSNQENHRMVDKLGKLLGRKPKASAKEAFEAAKTNMRGEDDNPIQMICDLISSDASPFTPDDFYGLQSMSSASLEDLRDTYLGDLSVGDDATTNSNRHEGGQSVADDPNKKPDPSGQAESGLPKTLAELNAMITNSVVSAMTGALAPITEALKANALSVEDKAALERARKINDEHRTSLVAKIVANSNMTKEAVAGWDIAQLETVASGLKPVTANYAGRGMPIVEDSPVEADKPIINAMAMPKLGELIRANKGKAH